MKFYLIRFLTVFLVSASVGSAATIQWGVEFSGATYSDGNPVLDDFTFELGTFGAAFTPASENVGSWRNNFLTSGLETNTVQWTNGQQPVFPTFGEGIGNSTFRAGGDVQEGDSVFLWGYSSQSSAAGSEWFLLTNPVWLFPAATPVGAEPGSITSFYATDPGTQLLFGNSFNLAGNADLFDRAWQTEVVPEPTTYALLFGLGVVGFVAVRRRLKA